MLLTTFRQVAQPSPAMDLSFADDKALDARVTFTRASVGTYWDAAGVLQTALANAPRFDHVPSTGESLGLLIEEARTNLLLNSAVLVTQNITTTAAARTLSFYGTGTVTLSGTHAAAVVGTGASPTRTTYTYTPTAGTLTLTVSGSVLNAQDELGAFASSWIPTAGTAVTRAADSATMTGTNFSSWYNQSEGTFVASARPLRSAGSYDYGIFSASDNSANERLDLRNSDNGLLYSFITDGGVNQALLSRAGSFTAGATTRAALAYALNDFAVSVAGTSPVVDTAGTLPTPDRLHIGALDSGASKWNGHIARITFYNKRLSDPLLSRLST